MKKKLYAGGIGMFISDILFPFSCLSCNKYNEWLCEDCLSKTAREVDQFCPVCEKVKTPDGKTCIPCKKKSSLSGLLVCASYKEKIISKMIHTFKYKFIPDISIPLAKIMSNIFLSSSIKLPDIIIPVPLHKRRLRWRGFNQSSLLAKHLSENLAPGFNIEFAENILIRERHTKSQMKIKDYRQRSENVSGAFSIKNNHQLKGKSVLLVDDVATTGSTIFECAKILKKSGAKEVFSIVVSRQSFNIDN